MSAPSEDPKLPAGEINLTAQQLADIIWLMVQIKPSMDTAEVRTKDSSPSTPSSPQNPESSTVLESVEIVQDTTPAYVDSPPNHPASPGLPLKITDPLALRNTLALGRSLRPLMRKVPSITEMVLDEEATVTSIAEEDRWLPVLQPVSTRWLEVALVIEETARYPLWRQILTEFQQLLERHGAFRHVSLWHLKIDDEGKIQLYLKNRQASFKELNDPSGRRLIWLVSDCVSPIWHNGSLLKVLRDWARIQPVSLLQLLPERLWSRTALGWGLEVKLYSENPGVPNARLLKTRQPIDKKFNSPQALTLPIVTLESLPMKNWAKVLAGMGGSRTPGLVFLPEEITPSASDEENNQLSPQARVSRFQAAASPLSRQLARMMAAVPVSLPIIRLIQQTLLRDSQAVHLAEVFMGGLLRVDEQVNYEFYPGVREELIKITRKSQTIDVILCLSEFINRELQLRQSVRNFDAMLFDPHVKVDPDYLPVAQITAQTLQLLGGKYADMGKQIQEKVTLSSKTITYSSYSALGVAVEGRGSLVEKFETVTINRRGEIISRLTNVAPYFTETIVPGILLHMVSIRGGEFMMGSPPDETQRYDDESPQHQVTISPFFMGKYPITQAQWRAVAVLKPVNLKLDPNPSYFQGDNLPVEQISWYAAVEFCARISEHTGRKYRLPSEAEWEYACRAGTTTPFHFGETIKADLANYNAEVTYGDEPAGKRRHKTTPVGSFKFANPFGLYDMHGNILEWCADHRHGSYVGAPSDDSAWIDKDFGGNDNHSRLLRGGSWLSFPWDCRSAFRAGSGPVTGDDYIGFRVVVSAASTALYQSRRMGMRRAC